MDILALARVHAHLCGDGLVAIYKSSQKDRNTLGYVVYFNSNEELIQGFRKDMQSLFQVKMTYVPKRQTLKIQSVRIARFLKTLSEYHSYKWGIPDLFLSASKEVKLEWIKAFIHDEGYLPKDRNWIRIKSVNENGLLQVKAMVDSLGINCKITGPNCDHTWYLNIKKEKDLADFTKVPARKTKVAGGGFEFGDKAVKLLSPPTSRL